MKPSLFFFLLIAFMTTQAQPTEDWPSDADIQYVEQKRAHFPWKNIVSDVDWYKPLEVVKGDTKKNVLISDNTKGLPSSVTKNAIALGEKHDSYALLVWHDGAIVLEKYWKNFDQRSRFDTASMHKTVVAALVGIAMDEGLIKSIDEPLGNYLHDLQNSDMARAPLKSLLEMSSGATSAKFSQESASLYWQSYLGTDLKTSFYRTPVEKQPFEEFYYANANPQYFAWLLEKVSGKRYAEYLSEKLWQPTGAQDARVWLDREGGTPRTSCCIQASARDWLKFGLLLMNKGKVNDKTVLSESWVTQMFSPSKMNPNYGYLIWRGSPHNPARSYNRKSPIRVPAKEPFLVDDIAYLDGYGGQRVYISPSQQLVIVRIGAPSASWDDSELPNIILSSLIDEK